jgi:hypothetical protein
MKHTLGKAGLVLVALLAITACSSRDPGLSSMVPSDAIAFAQISDLGTFFKNVQAFVDAIDLKSSLPVSNVKDMLSVVLGSTGTDLTLEDLDQTKPIGVAFLAPESGKEDPGFIVYLPLKKVDESTRKLADFLKSSGTEIATYQANGYGIFTTAESAMTFPPAQTIALPDYITLEKGGLTMYGDVAGIIKRYQEEWQAARAEALAGFESLESEESQMLGSGADISKAMIDGIFDAVEQAQGLAFHIRADEKGLTTLVQAGLSKDGSINAYVKKAGPGAGLTGAAKYVPSAYMMGGAVQAEPALWEDLSKALVDMYSKSSSLSDADKAFMTAIMADYAKYAGKQSTVAFDMDLDPEALAMVGEDISQLANAFTIRTLMSMDSKDAKGYLDHIKKTLIDPAFTSYLSGVFESSKMSLKVQSEDKKVGDLDYIRVSYKFEATDLEGLDPSDPMVVGMQMSAAMFDRMVLNIAAKGNKIFMTMDDPDGAQLKAFADKDGVEGPLADTAAWKEYAATVPSDAQYFGYFSLPRLADIVTNLDPSGSMSIDIPAEERTGAFGYLRAKDGLIESQAFWSVKELNPVLKSVMKILPSLMGGM